MSLPSSRKGTRTSQVINRLRHLHRSAVSSKIAYSLAMPCLILTNMPSLQTANMDFVPVVAARHDLTDFTMT